MKFECLLDRFGGQAWFDLSSVALFFPEGGTAIATSLYRFRRAGRVVELRRGLWTFGERFRRHPVPAPAVAGALYSPSYLSLHWALSWHGVIPEAATVLTSVTTRSTRSFENSFGVFTYRSLKPALFHGSTVETIDGLPVRMASAEKALFDFWYLESGEWDETRHESMRFEPASVDLAVLSRLVADSGLPRLERAFAAFERYAAHELEGRVER